MASKNVELSLKKTTLQQSILSLVRKNSFIITFAALSIFYVTVSLLWFKIDRRPPRWDESHNLTISQHSFQALQRGNLLGALQLEGITTTKPGLIPFLSACSYFLVGDSEELATFLVNGISMLLVFFSLLRLSKDLTNRIDLGAIAALLFCNVPVVLVFSGYYQVESAVTALVCFTVWLTLAIERAGFRKKGVSILLGLTVMLGMGAKHLYVVYVFAPLALMVCRTVISGTRPFRLALQQRLPLMISLAMGAGIGVLYHAYNFHIILEQWARSKDSMLTGGLGTSPKAWSVFIGLLSPTQLASAFWIFLFCLGVVISFVMKRWQVEYLLLSIVGGYIGVNYVASWPMSFYFLPLLPLFFFVCVIPVGVSIPLRWRSARVLERGRDLAAFAAICILALHHLEARIGTRDIFQVVSKVPTVLLASEPLAENPFTKDQYWNTAYVDGNQAILPYPHKWPLEDMLREVAREIRLRPNPRMYRLASLTSYEWMSSNLLEYKVWQLHLQHQLKYVVPLPPPATESLELFLSKYDFLILKTGRVLKQDFYLAEWARKSQAFVDEMTRNDFAVLRENGFTVLQRYDLPDGSEGTVWKSSRRFSSLLQDLPLAKRTISQPGYCTISSFIIDNKQREVLFQHPVPPPHLNELAFENISIDPGSKLAFGIALDPVSWSPGKGDGVEFILDISCEGQRKRFFNKYIDPKNNPQDRHWHDFLIDLHEFANNKITVILQTKPGPHDDINSDWAGWSDLRIQSAESTRQEPTQ
jgi:hypothetical protein